MSLRVATICVDDAWDGRILGENGFVLWTCGHAHDNRRDAQTCANREAKRRGIVKWPPPRETK